MPHAYNRQVFRKVAQTANPLAAIYGTLVEIELALKDKEFAETGVWRKGHAIVTWIAALGEASAAEALRLELSKLVCTDQVGQAAQVDANRFPHLRYIRHVQDFPQGCDDKLLEDVLAVVQSTRHLLATRGVIQ